MELKGRNYAHQRTTAAAPGLQFAPPVAFIHLAIVQGAVYDSVNAIKGGHDPYLKGLKAATSASHGAAASTAAHHVLIGLVNQAPLTATLTAQVKSDIKARLDAEYASSLAEIPDRPGKGQGDRSRSRGCGGDASQSDRVTAASERPAFLSGRAPGEWRPRPRPRKRSERMGAQCATIHPAASGIFPHVRAVAPGKRTICGRVQ